MGNLFSSGNGKKKRKSRVTEQDEAILQLKTQRDKIRQYHRRIEVQLERERQVARQLLQEGKKDRAKLLLKKKRYQEQLIERAFKQLDTIDNMVHDLEFADIEVQVLDGLKAGNESLKKIHRLQLMSLEDVEKILDETRESVEYQHEIDSLISGELSDTDISEVEDELAAILAESEAKDERIGDKLPDVPTDELPQETQRSAAREKRRQKEENREAEMLAA